MSVGIRSRTERPAYEETSEHFQVGVALPWSAEKPNVPPSSSALATHVRPRAQALNTGTGEASADAGGQRQGSLLSRNIRHDCRTFSERPLSPGRRRITGRLWKIGFVPVRAQWWAQSTNSLTQHCSEPRGRHQNPSHGLWLEVDPIGPYCFPMRNRAGREPIRTSIGTGAAVDAPWIRRLIKPLCESVPLLKETGPHSPSNQKSESTNAFARYTKKAFGRWGKTVEVWKSD